MARFAVGQHVELYTTVPFPARGSAAGGKRAVMREVAEDASGDTYRVALLANEQLTAELLWLTEADLGEA